MSTIGDSDSATPVSVVREGLTYAEIQGFRPLLLDLHVPSTATATSPVPVVVWMHGGAFWAGDRRHLPNVVSDALAAAGMAAATIDYRLSGEARFPAQLNDVRAAIGYLHSHASEWGLDINRVGVWGESAGGTLAALAALAPSGDDADAATDLPIAAAALWCAPTDLVTLRHFSAISGLLGDHADEDLLAAATQASPVTHVHRDAPPFLIMHATADATLPLKQSELLHEQLLAVGARSTLVRVEDAGHVFTGHPDPQQLVDQTVAFLAQELARAS
jgi:acetyl esterase/lipase